MFVIYAEENSLQVTYYISCCCFCLPDEHSASYCTHGFKQCRPHSHCTNGYFV